MKKFNGMESKLIIDALDCYITQVEKDILELEKDGKRSIFAPGFYTNISNDLKYKVKSMTKKEKYLITDCKAEHGLVTDNVRYEAFEGLDPMTENYIRNMGANGETLNKNPQITMSTIHVAKGGEADKVLLMQDLTNAALETFSHDPDELHRLFYTGATREKRELHVLDPRDFDKDYIL